MSRLIETICIKEGKVQHLRWHQQRLDKSFGLLFPGHEPYDLPSILTNLTFEQGWIKCRIEYDAQNYEVSFSPYQKAVFTRPVFVEIGQEKYDLKYADRKWINDLQQRWSDPDAIIMVRQGKLTDGTYTNIALFRNGQWYTPATPLLEGTCRERLLQEGVLHTAVIRKADIHWFEKIRMFNAMTGWEDAWELSLENRIFHG